MVWVGNGKQGDTAVSVRARSQKGNISQAQAEARVLWDCCCWRGTCSCVFFVLKPAPGLIISALTWTALKNCWWFNVNQLNNTNKALGKQSQHEKFHFHCPRKSSATTEQFSSALDFLQEVILGFLSIFWVPASPIWELVAPCHHLKDEIPVTNNLWALPAAHWCI